jgi:hypothetical protein
MEKSRHLSQADGKGSSTIVNGIKEKLHNSHQQKRVLHVFINPLCLNCMERIIEIKQFGDVLNSLNIMVVFYCEGSKEEAKTIKADLRLPYRVISINNKSQLWKESQVTLVPFYTLTDKRGEIKYSGRFRDNWAELKQSLLEEYHSNHR